MSGVVVWFTGLPQSGKSTLARMTREALVAAGVQSVLLDSDELRASMVPAYGYDEESRAAFYTTLANLAASFAKQGQVVLVAATAHRRQFRELASSRAPRFVEVYLDVPAEECARRDHKGLYAAAEAGEIRDLPGAGGEYEPPVAPDVVATGGDDTRALSRILARVAN